MFMLLKDNRVPTGPLIPINATIFHVDIRDYGFMPENFTIKKGEEIIWKNLGTGNHSVIFPEMNLSSGIMVVEAEYSVVFNYSGNFTYGCGLHPDKLGKITVD